MRALLPVLALSLLAACGQVSLPNPFARAAPPAAGSPITGPAVETSALPVAGGVTAAALDGTTAAERAAATAAAAPGGREIGRTVASLRAVTEPGLWFAAPFVAAVGPGRVVLASGASVAVELRPGPVAALSLAGYRALALPLTDLPAVTVLAD
ncbi:MAG: hypothetical protein IE927_16170 [Rhodobacterales bacterium]|nr:hypothetical protein [Rhodobacterales bacterium]